MKNSDRIKHWENIYQTKNLNEVSWYQPTPQTSLDFLKKYNIPTQAKIIDIGGGDSFFVDHLLNLGYTNITVLDISQTAIEKAKQRLGKKAATVKWIIADASTFQPTEKYDFWHDRATFHFLTDEKEITNYLETAQQNTTSSGFLVIGTFSEQGPKKCSGIEIKQYSEKGMTDRLQPYFKKIDCVTVKHTTPFATDQNFVFCSFIKIQNELKPQDKVLNQTFWDRKYQTQSTAWDLGQVSPPIKSYIDTLKNKNSRILIPGCGNCYEANYLLEKGFTNITLIDIAPTLVKKLKNKYRDNAKITVILGDFFEHVATYDIIIEQTFFCALPPALRTQYVLKMHQLLAEEGKIIGLLFNRAFDGGPPFGGSHKEYEMLFKETFDILMMVICQNSAKPRDGSELWIELQKN